eukprot:TRINITY_DN13771_c0_g5_i1.p2 TRINITY_DN13771_c0_g5~~TRINITY_DN13771_c0_g5_i1.p2  ORF type:complete len:437 (-),score=128.53 TRINITY_DN13771_c0_g5_i1:508-1818(-)
MQLIRKNRKMRLQRLLICTWIVEISMASLKQGEILTMSELPENATRDEQEERERQLKLHQEAQGSFQDFLEEHSKDLESETVFSMLKAHGRFDDFLFFASKKDNNEAIMLHYMNNRKYHQAISILMNVGDRAVKCSLMVKYGSIFMKQIPMETINILEKFFKNVDVEPLLPAFMTMQESNRSIAIDYIRELRIGTSSKMLNNLYAFFLAQSDDEASAQELSEFLSHQERLIRSNQPVHIDREFLLSICKYYNRVNARIQVYGIYQLYEEAVHLALKVGNLELAKEYANKPPDDKVKKKLWIEVAKKSLEDYTDRDKSIPKVLNESTVLTVGDLLPLVSPNMTLSTFKTELETSLNNYDFKINELKSEMKGFSKCSEDISGQFQETKNTVIPIAGEQCCEKCKAPLLGNERVFIFPCTHGFHRVFLCISCRTVWCIG